MLASDIPYLKVYRSTLPPLYVKDTRLEDLKLGRFTSRPFVSVTEVHLLRAPTPSHGLLRS